MGAVQQVLAAQGGAGGGSAGPYRYWRLYITARDGDPDYTSIGELELLDGATDLTNGLGGSATASASGIGAASAAVDGDQDNPWGSSNALPQWWAIDLGSAQTLTSYTIRSQHAVTGRTPTQWELQGNNASADPGETWTMVDAQTGETGWGLKEQRTYTL